MTDIRTILAERGATHGRYDEHAAVTQKIKYAMYGGTNWNVLTFDQRETLEMIAHKIGRILSGDQYHPDHWDDIAGYATLSGDLARQATKKGSPDFADALDSIETIHE